MATVGLSLVRRQAENVKAPRFLHCEFPLGRPLGRPNDPDFQTDVLRRAFALLGRNDVPVIEDHPEVIVDEAEQPLFCALPPRLDPAVHPAIEEAAGLRAAYERQRATAEGRTALGRVISPDTVAATIDRFVTLAANGDLGAAGYDADQVRAASQDLRAYYEEAALALADHVPAARQAETWFYTQTQTGALIKAAATAVRAADGDRNVWYYLLPASQQD